MKWLFLIYYAVVVQFLFGLSIAGADTAALIPDGGDVVPVSVLVNSVAQFVFFDIALPAYIFVALYSTIVYFRHRRDAKKKEVSKKTFLIASAITLGLGILATLSWLTTQYGHF